ncbi:MAG: DinB family protein [Trueperaceae bacterium]|nr:DinB family protein [Trueperaceae bacterium]
MTVIATTTTEQLARQLNEIWDEARALIAPLSDAEFLERPAPGQWSVSECLTHLNVTGHDYLAEIDKATARGHEQDICGSGPFRYGLIGGTFIRLTEPPVRMRVGAPGRWTPAPDLDPDEIRREFDDLQAALHERLAKADGLDLNRITLHSPLTRWLRLDLYEAFSLVLAHERRHLWQARRVLDAIAAK